MDDRNWRVYIHEFPNGKVYIGITSKSVYKRWGRNGSGYSGQGFVGRAISCYGWDNILHDIEAIDLTFEEACKMGKDLIAEYNSNDRRHGYNLTQGGEGVCGYHFSKETRSKMSDILKGEMNPFYGKEHSEATKKLISQKNKGRYAGCKSVRAKRILQIDVDTNEVIAEYESISMNPFGETARWHISDCCNGKRNTCRGYKRQYVGELHKHTTNWSTLRSVSQIDLNTNNVIKIWDTMREAVIELGIKDSICIKKCCDGERRSGYWYGWAWADDCNGVNIK